MRNIYDIIAEQKAIVDVNMAKYDLDYTISQLANNEYYMQEALGENVKNAINKVVEFIKTVIAKIRELVKKMIDFLLGRKSSVPLDDINDAIGEGGAQGKSSDVYDTNIHKGKKNVSMRDIFAGSLRTVNMIKFVDFKVKEGITDTFLNAVNGVVGNHLSTFFADKYKNENRQLLKAVKRACFKGKGSYKAVPEASMAERIALEVGEPKEAQPVKVKDIPMNVVESYLSADMDKGGDGGSGGKGLSKYLNDAQSHSIKQLEQLKSQLEGARNGGAEIDQSNISQVEQLITMVSSFISAMTSNVFKAYNAFFTVYEQAKKDFCSAYGVTMN
jgi:hypothetical protein